MLKLSFKERVKDMWLELVRSPIRILGLIALFFAFLFALLGFDSVWEFLANMSVELTSIALTILIIDYLNEKRDDKHLKAQLIREMGSGDNGMVQRAYRELEARRWLNELQNVNLSKANFQGLDIWNANFEGASLYRANFEDAHLVNVNFENANLSNANLKNISITGWLKGANLNGANLEGARLSIADLQSVSLEGANLLNSHITVEAFANMDMLAWATMPNGEKYDGRYNLVGDIELAIFNMELAGYEEKEIPGNSRAMAKFYGVPIRKYKLGQEWAEKNLEKLRRSHTG
ncbi:MAG: pentapeptide repeat-containing protein [Chloroflexi bacterium]|nr:pentapeptide repeat-containing protein [Chloroflexota bacterium]